MTGRRFATAGHAAGHDLIILPGLVVVTDPEGGIARHEVPNYGTDVFDLAGRPGFRIGWGRFPDGDLVIYLYDKDDHGFGYALNVDWPGGSEWGYAPIATEEEETPPADRCEECGAKLGGLGAEDGYCPACYLERYGEPESDNPYPHGTQAWHAWNARRRISPTADGDRP